MRFKAIVISCLILASCLAIPVNAAVEVAPIEGGRRPSGYPDEFSAMPCCMIPDPEPIEHYTVNGQSLSIDMQNYIYRLCKDMGIEFYYPYFLCQIYQESRFNPNAVSKSGLDFGYCQLRIYYHEHFKSLVGHPEWDLINDPFANLYVGCYLMKTNLEACGYDISGALAMYYNSGSDYWNSVYVNDVTQWVPTLERIE